MNQTIDTQAIVDQAVTDREFRTQLVRESMYWFLHIYFPEYLTYPLAEFQKEIVRTVENENKNIVIAAFRGSGKSTIISQAFVLWSMLGLKKKRFIVLISHTVRQAETLMHSIKTTLENNELLKSDLGPFYEKSEEWKISSLVFKNYDAKIMATSVNESIRGIRYKNVRPDLIVCDDVETLDSVRTDENKDKLITWFDRDIVPIGDEGTTVIVLGTIMASGALIQTLRDRIIRGEMNGVFKEYPIITKDDQILWNSRWPSTSDLEKFKKDRGIIEKSWQTEYLLKDWIDEYQIISKDMITYYAGSVPDVQSRFRSTVIAVDLAVSQKQTADYTAIVCGEFYGYGEESVLYILPSPINRRMKFPQTKDLLKNLYNGLSNSNKSPTLVIEGVGTQKGFIQDLQNEGYPVKEFSPGSQDKYSRLWRASPMISKGRVLFPREGAETLINQLTNFGVVVQHDDLVDSLVMCVLHTVENKKRKYRTWSHKPQGF